MNKLWSQTWFRCLVAIAVTGALYGVTCFIESRQPTLAQPEDWAKLKTAVFGVLIISVTTVLTILVPKPPPETGEKPIKSESNRVAGPSATDYDECCEKLAIAMEEIAQWKLYRKDVDVYLEKKDKLEAFLDTRCATLRLTLVFILVLAVCVGVAGLIATRNFDYVGDSLAGAVAGVIDGGKFVKNLSVLSVAYLVVGSVIGCALYWIRAATTFRHAWRCALWVSLVLNIGSLSVTLPTMAAKVWMQKVEVIGIEGWPLIAWLVSYRLILAPSICVGASIICFSALEWLKNRRHPRAT